MVKERGERLEEDLLVVPCFCICKGTALLGRVLKTSRSVEREFPFVLSYRRIILSVFSFFSLIRDMCMYSVFFFKCVSCFGLVVSTCQVIG